MELDERQNYRHVPDGAKGTGGNTVFASSGVDA
jgi:hypothetical protein